MQSVHESVRDSRGCLPSPVPSLGKRLELSWQRLGVVGRSPELRSSQIPSSLNTRPTLIVHRLRQPRRHLQPMNVPARRTVVPPQRPLHTARSPRVGRRTSFCFSISRLCETVSSTSEPVDVTSGDPVRSNLKPRTHSLRCPTCVPKRCRSRMKE